MIKRTRRLYITCSSLLQLNIEMANLILYKSILIINRVTHGDYLKNKLKIVDSVGEGILALEIRKLLELYYLVSKSLNR